GFTWLDTGTPSSLLEASQFVEILERRQGLKICCPEEIAFYKGYIDEERLVQNAFRHGKSGYGEYLINLTKHAPRGVSLHIKRIKYRKREFGVCDFLIRPPRLVGAESSNPLSDYPLKY